MRCWVELSMRGSSISMTGQVAPVQPVGQPRGGDRGDRRGIGDHEPDPRRRQRRVDRQIGRPGLEHRQDRHDRLGGTGKQQRHTLSRARPLAGQQVRQPVSGLIELAVGPRALPAAQRHRLRGALPPARRTTPESTPQGSPAGSTPPGCPSHPAGRAHRHRAHPSTTTAAPDRRSSPPTPAATVPLNRRRQNSKMAAQRPPC